MYNFFVEEIHRYSAKILNQVERVEEAFRLNFNRVKVALIEIDVEWEKENLNFCKQERNYFIGFFPAFALALPAT
jgi:6-pyruvoyl-tetrahydropterin synthase